MKLRNHSLSITHYFPLALLLLLYLAVALAHACLAPLTTGPDELAHYEYVRFIADHGHLPLDAKERQQASYKSDQPPLYHLLAALPTALVDPAGPPFLKRVSDHPRRQLIERTRHAWGLYNTEDEHWPYSAEILRWFISRWVSILFGAAVVAITFFIARDVFKPVAKHEPSPLPLSSTPPPSTFHSPSPVPHPPSPNPHPPTLLPLASAVLVAFIPRFVLTGAMLNYETAEAFFSALFLWTLIRFTIYDLRFTIYDLRFTIYDLRFTIYDLRFTIYDIVPFGYLRFTIYDFYASFLGLLAGLAILTKLSALVLPLEAAIGLWLIITAATRSADGKTQPAIRLKLWLRYVFITTASTLAVLSLWFGFILYQFNTVAEDGLWTGLLRPLVAADASDATTNQLLSFLTGGQAGFTGAIENMESGPPWEWAIIFFRTFWSVGIENVQPLVPAALIIALALCLLATAGLIWTYRLPSQKLFTKTAGHEASLPETESSPPLLCLPSLLLSLLLLHLFIPFILPLLRYAVTFSLADTAQGRHVLFMAAPAFAILLIWGLTNFPFNISRLILPSTLPPPTPHPLTPFLPGLFVFVWTGVQLWTMTWAYNPPLPVSALPEAKAQASRPLNQPLNKFVTLVGYNSQIDPDERLLRLDLIWQSTAISAVDYLTEVNLIDAQGQTQAQWLGYAANGRYPTRAWDVGDIIRDTVWLPIAGLKSGSYQLSLALLPTSHNYPPEQTTTPFTLTEITLSSPSLRLFNKALPFTGSAQTAAGYSVWRNGQTLTTPQTFGYRETVLVTFSPLLPEQQRVVRMIGSNSTQPFTPLREVNNTALFIVGPDWSTGDYHLQVAVEPADGSEPQQANSGLVLSVIDRWQRQFTQPPITRRIEANFADQVKLLGYDLGANRAEPGGGIPLTLYWQGLDWMGTDYTIFTKLLAADGVVYGGRDRLPREGYRTIYWAPGEVITDSFGAPVDAAAPDGVYHLNIGLYKQVGQQAVSLPLMQDGRPIDATSIDIGPLKIGGPPPGLTLSDAKPQYPVHQSFGEPANITLLGYDLKPLPADNTSADNGQYTKDAMLSIKLYWRSDSILPLDYTTFIHFRNAAGDTVAQKDQPPLAGAYPTSLWDPGEIIADQIDLPLPADLPAGVYQIVIGWYDLQTGQRLVVPNNPANEVELTNVDIR